MNLTSLASLIEDCYTNVPLNTPLKDVWPKAARAVAIAIANDLKASNCDCASHIADSIFGIPPRDGDAVMF